MASHLPPRLTVARPRTKLRTASRAENGVATANRVLKILSAFRAGDQALELSELADRTGLAKSTTLRLARSLEQLGFVARRIDGAYQLGAELHRLNAVYQTSLDLESRVLPILTRLAHGSRELATFFVRHGVYRLCLYRVDTPHTLKVDIKAGDTRPMDQAATAIVLRTFEYASPNEPVPIELPVYTCGTTDPHASSMAVPVIGVSPAIVGAIGLHGPTSRLSRERGTEVSGMLMEAGASLTKALGGKFPY